MIAQIKILCKGFSVPDYRSGETEKDVDRKELLINSNVVSVRRETYNLDKDELLAWLKIVKNLVDGSIKKEEERIKMENSERKELIIDEMEADMKAMKFFITKQACIPYQNKCDICGLKKMCDAVINLDDVVREFAGRIKL